MKSAVVSRICFIAVAWFAACCGAFAQQAKPVEPAIAFAARIVGDDNRSRLIVDFDRSLKHDVYLLDDPRRIVVDMERTIFSLEGEGRRLPPGMIAAMRYGSVAAGKSRIVLELKRPILIEDHSLRKLETTGRYRLMVDLVAAKDTEFAAAVRPAPVKARRASSSRQDTAPARRFKIVLDPGHGGIDGGATGANRTREKFVTLEFALQLSSVLKSNPRFDVSLTRDTDKFMDLRKRLAFAREIGADLLISIHADSLRQRDIRGATVYTLSAKGSDDQSRALARRQNRADLVAGLKLPEYQPDVTDILIDLTRRETKVFSGQLANLIVTHMKDQIRLIRNPHRSADFFVLKAPEIPSVLLELGYLSNLQDEALMNSPEWRAKAVATVAKAVEGFFETRTAARR